MAQQRADPPETNIVAHISAAAGWTAPSCTQAPHWHRPSTTNCRNVGWSQIRRKTAAFGLFKSLLLPGTLESRILNDSGSHLAQRWREICREANDLEDNIVQECRLKRDHFHGARLDIPFFCVVLLLIEIPPLTPLLPKVDTGPAGCILVEQMPANAVLRPRTQQ